MIKDTPFLPNFPVRFGRPRKSFKMVVSDELATLEKQPLKRISRYLSSWIDLSGFDQSSSGPNSRVRIFDLKTVFVANVLQILNKESCAASVKRVQSWKKAEGRKLPSSNTSAYCQARNRFPADTLESIFKETVSRIDSQVTPKELWRGRRVKLVDGTGLSAPDTRDNQKSWPQNGAISKGCGFPQINMVGLFCLASGALLGYAKGNKHRGEQSLWKDLEQLLQPEDLVVGDRGYCSYANLASLINLGADAVFRLHQQRKVDWRLGKRISRNDQVFTWYKPPTRTKGMTVREWKKIPRTLRIRVLKVTLKRQGFRTRHLTLATTLLDPDITAAELTEIYMKRWQVESCYKDIKTTLGMDVLSSRSPKNIESEIMFYTIAYNLLRGIIQKSAHRYSVPLHQVSFANAIGQVVNWLWLFIQSTGIGYRALVQDFEKHIIDTLVIPRPGRSEPRCRKRRPKNYILMNKPRQEMVVDCHRNNTSRKNALFGLT